MKKEIQIDLFKDKEFEQKNRGRNHYSLLFNRIFPYEFINIKVSLEGIVFFFIVFILWSIMLFSLGIERGKKLIFINKELSAYKISKSDNKQKYTIQVKTFKDRSSTIQFLKELMQNGYKPFVIYHRNLYHICIGKYANRELAKEDLDKLVNKYKYSYIRSIP